MPTKEKLHAATGSMKLDGYAAKDEVFKLLPNDRMLMSLSQAASIPEAGSYWVHMRSRELDPREVSGKGYKGRTFEGVPTIEGHYAINADNTFTKLNHKDDADWSERLYVSPIAAADATRGEGHAILHVMCYKSYLTNMDSFLSIFPDISRPSNYARIASLPKPSQEQDMVIAAAEAVRK